MFPECLPRSEIVAPFGESLQTALVTTADVRGRFRDSKWSLPDNRSCVSHALHRRSAQGTGIKRVSIPGGARESSSPTGTTGRTSPSRYAAGHVEAVAAVVAYLASPGGPDEALTVQLQTVLTANL